MKRKRLSQKVNNWVQRKILRNFISSETHLMEVESSQILLRQPMKYFLEFERNTSGNVT